MKRTIASAGPARHLLLLGLAVMGLIPVACSGGEGKARVSGKVTYNGQPVPMGTVTFLPTTPQGRNAVGAIGADGSYTLQTDEAGDGALIGEYNVAIVARDEPVLDYTPKVPIKPKYLVPAKYEKPDTSGLKATVKSGSNTIDFPLSD